MEQPTPRPAPTQEVADVDDLTSRVPDDSQATVEAVCTGCGERIARGAGWLVVNVDAALWAERARSEIQERTGGLISLDDMVDTYPGVESWQAWHRVCDPDADDGFHRYYIEVDQIATWPKVAAWTAHLLDKSWLPATDWSDLLRRLANGAEGPLRGAA